MKAMKKNFFLIVCLALIISSTQINAQSATKNNDTKITTEAGVATNVTEKAEKTVEEITTKEIKKTKCSANLKNSTAKSCCKASKKECTKAEKAKCAEKKKCTKAEKEKCSEKKAIKTSNNPKTRKCTANLSALPKQYPAD